MCVTHGMQCVNMHDSFEAYIRGFTWAVLTSKGGKQGKGEKWRRKEGEGRRRPIGNKRVNDCRWERRPLV